MWSEAMGIRIVHASATEVVAELAIDDRHLQRAGIVHGGVYAGLIESIASYGAALAARAHGRTVVGLENQTSFLRAVRGGTLRARATPVHTGKTTQLWEGDVRDEQDRVVATGRVRLLSLEPA